MEREVSLIPCRCGNLASILILANKNDKKFIVCPLPLLHPVDVRSDAKQREEVPGEDSYAGLLLVSVLSPICLALWMDPGDVH